MKQSYRTGFGFGLTSAAITTLGLIIGLDAGTNSVPIVLGGIITIAIADALSDSLAIHLAQESDRMKSAKSIWEAMFSTFISKLIFALTFAVPVIFLPLDMAIYADIVWGFLLLGALSYYIAKIKNVSPLYTIAEHWIIMAFVLAASYFVGVYVISGVK